MPSLTSSRFVREIDLEGVQCQRRVAAADAKLDAPVGQHVLHRRARGDAQGVVHPAWQQGDRMGEAQRLGQREKVGEENLGTGGRDATDRVLLFGYAERVETPFFGVDDLLDQLPTAGLVGCAGQRFGLREEHELHAWCSAFGWRADLAPSPLSTKRTISLVAAASPCLPIDQKRRGQIVQRKSAVSSALRMLTSPLRITSAGRRSAGTRQPARRSRAGPPQRRGTLRVPRCHRSDDAAERSTRSSDRRRTGAGR